MWTGSGPLPSRSAKPFSKWGGVGAGGPVPLEWNRRGLDLDLDTIKAGKNAGGDDDDAPDLSRLCALDATFDRVHNPIHHFVDLGQALCALFDWQVRQVDINRQAGKSR